MPGVRFAPSPTGRFHLGNLRTAWISHEWAKALGEPWVLRFEDIDRPRVLAGAQEAQLADMRALGLQGDQLVIQSAREERHWELLVRACREGRAYPCFCSRKEVLEALQAAGSAPHGAPPIYNGRCRDISRRPAHAHPTIAWRFTGEEDDGSQDFIVARTSLGAGSAWPEAMPDRASFAPSYQWACAIDDHDGDYSLLVRAWDLEHAIPQQRAVHAWLSEVEGTRRAYPSVFHTSLVTNDDGSRLEKRTRGVTLSELEAAGIGPEELVRRFARSFAVEVSAFAPGKIWGEAKRTLPLRELGFDSLR
ncbi:MAG: glutamate--tRNA ligase family protein [Oligoflexia bacterium]|nr:glutamate--tRNA ligase family protein [Oligoflexia bacterium]